MKYSFSLSGQQYEKLKKHLLTDNLESVALIFCHQARGKNQTKLITFEIVLIADKDCERTATNIIWHPEKHLSATQIEKIDKDRLSLVTIHSHPSGFDKFSDMDNDNDKTLFASVNNWFDDNRPNGSAIMLPDGYIFGRLVTNKGEFISFSHISIAGSSIKIFRHKKRNNKVPESAKRVAQTFGKGTFFVLKQLKVGVVGCSGTGSIMIELLARNCIGEIVIVDPDVVEKKNLNRILNTSLNDAEQEKPKVEVLKKAIEKMGLETKVSIYQSTTSNQQVISALKECDVLFGCVDSAIGRYHLDCLSSAYLIPYFDVGVGLYANKKGNVSQALMVAHYIEPAVSSLLSRKVYTSEQVSAESLKINNPDHYAQQKKEGYVIGVDEDQPAVISVNMQASCMAFNDFMARIHNYRLDDNNEFSIQRISLIHGYYEHKEDNAEVHPLFIKNLGKADQSKLLC